LICTILYIIPRTAMLGAILLTGYFGGAICTHLRAHEPALIGALSFGVFIWLGLYLRDRRIRALIPLYSAGFDGA
ncbi:MAG TPA: DoxX family protein, partial [Tepidisphaeraceae bacterium]|nr:DoxX family protein [Tepidisphaeraceae bacterium]